MNDPEAKALEGTEGGDGPFFSPDGQWIAFFAGSKLGKISVGGAALQTLADAPTHRGGDWGRDGFIYFAPSNIGGIWRVPEGGGAATEVTRKQPEKDEISHRWPRRIGDTDTLLFSVWTGPGEDEHHVAMTEIGAAEHHVLVKGGDAPRYAGKVGALLCPSHGYLNGNQERCSVCNSQTEVYARIVGYLRPVKQWNEGKRAEFDLRKSFDIAGSSSYFWNKTGSPPFTSKRRNIARER